MHLVVCYDVVEDPRRRRLHDGLLGFLDHVQKSVFEGPLAADRYDALLHLVTRTIDHETDNVRIYSLCRGCARITDYIGVTEIVALEPEDIIL